ncbi:MAG: trigger factor, partial [Crocinitomicaceae bacterium]|nr:trigger factor [Crocinitomicaceae bacterium]
MNIAKTPIDDLLAELVIEIAPSDYNDRYETAVKNYRKQAKIPGFRPGHVPASLIRQRFGKSLLAEELNSVLQNAIHNYIENEKLNVLGNPLPVNDGEVGNWDNPGDFKFKYEVGLAPEFNLVLDKSQTCTYYRINVDDQLVNRQIKDYARRFGEMSAPETSEGEDLLTVQLQQLGTDGEVLDQGISSNSTIIIESVSDEDTRKSLIGVKKDDTVIVNPHFLTENHDDLAKILGITHHDVHHLESDFRLTVTDIRRIVPHELNSELFEKIFPGANLQTEEEFRKKIHTDLVEKFEQDSEWLFKRDFNFDIIDRTNFSLPDEFLKRLIASTGKPENAEQLEAAYPTYSLGLRRQLIHQKIITENNLNVSIQDALDSVKTMLARRFEQYG